MNVTYTDYVWAIWFVITPLVMITVPCSSAVFLTYSISRNHRLISHPTAIEYFCNEFQHNANHCGDYLLLCLLIFISGKVFSHSLSWRHHLIPYNPNTTSAASFDVSIYIFYNIYICHFCLRALNFYLDPECFLLISMFPQFSYTFLMADRTHVAFFVNKMCTFLYAIRDITGRGMWTPGVISLC